VIPAQSDLDWIVKRVTTFFDATTIYLFGSHAKGMAAPGSDIDLLIVGPSRLPRSRRGREVAAALAAFPAHFDLLFYTEAELAEARSDPLSFMATILAKARILYQRPQPSRGSAGSG
jgi:predicted nucleotidyltransferase